MVNRDIAFSWVRERVDNLTDEEFDKAVELYKSKYVVNPLDDEINRYTYKVPTLVEFVNQFRESKQGGRSRRRRKSRKSRKRSRR